MALTAEQQSAAKAAEPRVFVSAGAGTGKTLVLVSRYLELVLERGVPPESIAAITFTRKAAGELRARIRAGVIAAERPDLLQAIDRSPLGTIDSLCVRLLRSYGLFSGIHPSGRVLEESEARVLLDDALAQAVRDLVARAAERELDLVARHGKEIEEAARGSALRQQKGACGMRSTAWSALWLILAFPSPPLCRTTRRHVCVASGLTGVSPILPPLSR